MTSPASKIPTSWTKRSHRSGHLCLLHPQVAPQIPPPTEGGLALALEVQIRAVASQVRPVEVDRTPRARAATCTGAGHSHLRGTTDYPRGLPCRLALHGMGHRQAGRMGEMSSDETDLIRIGPAGDSRITSTRMFPTTAILMSARAIRVTTTPNRILNGATQIAVIIAVTLLDDEAEVLTLETRAEGDIPNCIVLISDSIGSFYRQVIMTILDPRTRTSETGRTECHHRYPGLSRSLWSYRSWKYILMRELARERS